MLQHLLMALHPAKPADAPSWEWFGLVAAETPASARRLVFLSDTPTTDGRSLSNLRHFVALHDFPRTLHPRLGRRRPTDIPERSRIPWARELRRHGGEAPIDASLDRWLSHVHPRVTLRVGN